MIRRHLVSALAVLALGLVVAAPAEAGGASSGAVGVKKNAYVKVANTTGTAYYVVVSPTSLGAPTTVYQAKQQGAYLLNPGKTVLYPVPAGTGTIYATAASKITAATTTLPVSDASAPYTVAKGKTQNATIKAGPIITVP